MVPHKFCMWLYGCCSWDVLTTTSTPHMSLAVVQTSALEEIDSALKQEYTVRRRMLIERAKVTLQSFMWADKLQMSQELKQAAQAAAQHGEALMHNEPTVSWEDVFRAKQGVTSLSVSYCCDFVVFVCTSRLVLFMSSILSHILRTDRSVLLLNSFLTQCTCGSQGCHAPWISLTS